MHNNIWKVFEKELQFFDVNTLIEFAAQEYNTSTFDIICSALISSNLMIRELADDFFDQFRHQIQLPEFVRQHVTDILIGRVPFRRFNKQAALLA